MENIRKFTNLGWGGRKGAKSSEKPTNPNSVKGASAVREKINNAWLSFKYGSWRLNSHMNFKEKAQLWLLGSCYSLTKDESRLQEFLHDYYSRIWLTYRTDLHSLPGTSKTTDCGWGCMLRSAQMMLAECLISLHLGREWRFSKDEIKPIIEDPRNVYAKIISLFSDDPHASLGLHKALKIAEKKYQRPVDSWYSPSEALGLFKELLGEADFVMTGGLKLLCVTDGILVKNEIQSASCNFTVPLLLVICLRLGTTKLNMFYQSHTLNLLNIKGTVGMIGGKPKHSLYFIGWYDEKYLIYLDPHIVHKAVPIDLQSSCWQSFHCTEVSKTQLDNIDPTCAFGFLIKSKHDFDVFLNDLQFHQLLNLNVFEGEERFKGTILSVVSDRSTFSITSAESDVHKVDDPGFEILHMEELGQNDS